MANLFANTQLVTFETLYLLQPNLVFAGSVNNEYSKEFGREGNKVGDTIQIRLPQQFLGRTGTAVNLEGITDRTIPLTLTTQFGVDFAVTSADLKLSVDDVRNRYLNKAAITIANKVDRDGFTLAAITSTNMVGVPGTALTNEDVIRDATVKLDEDETPLDDQRYIVVNSKQEQKILSATKIQFNDQAELGKQYRKGRMGVALGYNWTMSQTTPRLVAGTLGGVPTVSGANQTGALLNITALGANATVHVGDKFTIDGVFAVENISHVALASLQQFTVLSNTVANASGAAALSISPAITPTGQYQNVSGSPAAGAGVHFIQPTGVTYTAGMAYHRDAFTVAFARLDEPRGVESASVATDPDTGVSIRSVLFWNGMTDQWIYRFDCLYGWAALYPQTSCVIASD
jgi:hypothetical protein